MASELKANVPEPEYCWSSSDDWFTHTSLAELIFDEDINAGDVVYRGEKVELTGSVVFANGAAAHAAECILEQIQEGAYEECGEGAGDLVNFKDVVAEAALAAKIQGLVHAAIESGDIKIGCYKVEGVTEVEVTQNDVNES